MHHLSYLHAILMGVIQGVTELFPVSSLGHSVLVPELLAWGVLRQPVPPTIVRDMAFAFVVFGLIGTLVVFVLGIQGFMLALIGEYLDGVCTSGLWEARLASEFYDGEIATYSAAYKPEDLPDKIRFGHSQKGSLVIDSPNMTLEELEKEYILKVLNFTRWQKKRSSELLGINASTLYRKLGYNPTFIGSSAAYTDLIHKIGGKAMDGLYATMTVQNPYTDEQTPSIRFWANKYKTKFNEDPTVFSVYGYNAVDAFLRAASKAGNNLSTDSFIKAMDTMTVPPDMFGSAEATYSATKRLGSDKSRLSQIQDGKWKVMSDYPK